MTGDWQSRNLRTPAPCAGHQTGRSEDEQRIRARLGDHVKGCLNCTKSSSSSGDENQRVDWGAEGRPVVNRWGPYIVFIVIAYATSYAGGVIKVVGPPSPRVSSGTSHRPVGTSDHRPTLRCGWRRVRRYIVNHHIELAPHRDETVIRQRKIHDVDLGIIEE